MRGGGLGQRTEYLAKRGAKAACQSWQWRTCGAGLDLAASSQTARLKNEKRRALSEYSTPPPPYRPGRPKSSLHSIRVVTTPLASFLERKRACRVGPPEGISMLGSAGKKPDRSTWA